MNGMVSCTNCAAQNSLDSVFCKRCGSTLADDDLKQAKDKLEAAVADGFRIFNGGRTDEAMHIAETAVAANPTSTAALSLKAMCHERLGQIAEALECHEKVLDLDPDSMIDKIKVNDLRNLLVARSSIAAMPDRKMAIVGAVAATVLVLSIGVVLAKSGSKTPDKVAVNNPPVSQSQGPTGSHFDTPVGPPGSQNSGQGQVLQNPPANGGQPNNAPRNPSSSQDDSDRGSNAPLPKWPADRGHQLPKPGSDGENPSGPIILKPDQDLEAALHKNGNAAPNTAITNPNPQPTGSRPDDPPPSEAPAKQDAPGIMEIKITSRGGKSVGDSSDPGSHPNGVEALLRTARSQYQTGNYSGAATAYERALRAGADPSSANQRLAQCYEKLGRNSDATSAYNRAIDALQSAIGSGKGDKDRLNAALESCKQAIKVLGG